MANINEMIPSKYIAKHDLPTPKLWTIRSISQTSFNNGEKKWMVAFNEFSKTLTLNKTNIKALAEICGSAETNDWVGKQVVVYFDDSVMYMGDRVGGVRFRAKKPNTSQPSNSILDTATVVTDDNNPVADADVPF